MTAYQALGEGYVEGKLLELTQGEMSVNEARNIIRDEAIKKIEPLKRGLSPKVYEGFVKDGYSADDIADYMAYENERKQKEIKKKEDEAYARQVEAYAKQSKERFSGDSFSDRLGQGLLRVGSELDVVTDYINPFKNGKSDPATVGYLKANEEVSQAYKDKHRTPEQQATAKSHEEEFAKAEGTVDTVTAGSKVLWDTVSNPSEWDMAGVIAEVANPANLIGGGAGHVAGKVATKAATKAAVGAATGAVVEGGVNAGYEYASAKGQNKSDNEAKKAAILGGAMGVAIGVPTGAVGGAMAKSATGPGMKTAQTDTPHLMSAEEVSKQIALPEELANSALLKVEEVHKHSDVASDAITQLSTQIKDPVVLEIEVEKRLPPTKIEADYTLHINDGKPVSARLAGARVREALKKSMDAGVQTVETLDKKLVDAGFDAESRDAITTAYANKDMSIYDAYVGKKYAEAEQKGVDNVNGRNTQSNTAGEIDRGGERTGGAGETATQNAEPETIQKFSREYTEAKQSAGLDAGRGDTQDVVPQVDEAVGGQPTVTNDATGVYGDRADAVVQKQDGVRAKPTLANSATFDKETLTVAYDNGINKKGGHKNWRNNNPGNLEYGAFAKAHGAIGSDGRFAIFPSMSDGFSAQAALLHSKKYKNLTLQDAIYRYAPQFENDSGAYVQAVSKNASIPTDVVMKDLTPAQMERVVKAMSIHEGMKAGDITETSGRSIKNVTQREVATEKVLADNIEFKDVARVANDALDDVGTSEVELYDTGAVKLFEAMETPKAKQPKAVVIAKSVIDDEMMTHFSFSEKYVDRVVPPSAANHAINKHGKAETELPRGQLPITREDIATYPKIISGKPTMRAFGENARGNKIVYTAKQVNGHYVVVEEVASAKGRLTFYDMWKGKGKVSEAAMMTYINSKSPRGTSRTMTSKKSITQKAQNVKTRDELVQHRYFDDVVRYAEGSQNKEAFKPKRESVTALKEQLEKRGLDKSDDVYKAEMSKLFKKRTTRDDSGLHVYSKKEVARIKSGDIDNKFAVKLVQDLREYAANPLYKKDRELTDGGFRAFSDEAELFTQMKLDEALDIVQTQEYGRGYDGDMHFGDVSKMVDEIFIEQKTKHADVDSADVFDDVLGDERVRLDAESELTLAQIDDPVRRHRARKELEREKLNGDELKAWERENLDSEGNIKEIGEC